MVDNIVGSHEKAKNGYGQNGFQGPASDLPGKHTTSSFLPQVSLPTPDVTNKPGETGNWQTRKVDAAPYATHPGMKARNDKIDFPKANVRAATKRAMGGNYQR